MANTLVEMFRMKDIRKKILFTLGILAVTRVGAALPIPGINPGAVLSYFEEFSNSFTDYLNFFSGGAFANFSARAGSAGIKEDTAVYPLWYCPGMCNPVACRICLCSQHPRCDSNRLSPVHDCVDYKRNRRLDAHGMAW